MSKEKEAQKMLNEHLNSLNITESQDHTLRFLIQNYAEEFVNSKSSKPRKMNKEKIIRKKFHCFSDEQWQIIKKEFPYNEIPYILNEYAASIKTINKMTIKQAYKVLQSRNKTARQIANAIDVIYSGKTQNRDIRKLITKAIKNK